MTSRSTDDKSNVTHFRVGDRVFLHNNHYYFSSREGEQGPFASREMAQRELELYIAMSQGPNLQKKPQPAQAVPATAGKPKPRPDVWDNFDLVN